MSHSTLWKPNTVVAAIVEREGRYLCVEEDDGGRAVFNQPAGHLDPGESPLEGCARETLEETAYAFKPTALVGVYLSRFEKPVPGQAEPLDITYLRFAFCGELGELDVGRQLDEGIVRALWLTPDEIRASAERHRSPLLIHCMEDYLAGKRYSLDLLTTHESIYQIGASR